MEKGMSKIATGIKEWDVMTVWIYKSVKDLYGKKLLESLTLLSGNISIDIL